MNFLKQAAAAAEDGVNKVKAEVDKRTGGGKVKKTRAGPGAAVPEANATYASRAAEVCQGEVRMFSGCMDAQTSADVSNVASFGLPPVHPAEKAGGACTNALLSTLKNHGGAAVSFGQLLQEMQALLKQRKYTQVPQLSASRQVDLHAETYSPFNPRSSGRTKALLIGINYFGQKGELSGCVNDVRMMRQYLLDAGFQGDAAHMRVMTDDPSVADAPPTCRNVIAGMQWLLEGAQPGDSLFFHYSGHGGQMPDDNGDEDDGMDETLIPVDYQTQGQIRDDTIFKLLVAPLPRGVTLVSVFDCCHSGTILDLPYMFSANDQGCVALSSGGGGGGAAMQANPGFNFDFALQLVAQVAGGVFDVVSEIATRALAR
jgi:hypothetical protein